MDKFVSIRIPRRWLKTAAIVTVLAAVLAPVAAMASHQFTDVPDSNIFHADIAWLADNGVTLGCNPPANDQFCPSNNVTREQMAAFMKRLATKQVVDAGTLEGQTSDDLTSNGFSVYHDAAVNITGTTNVETVLELTGLPAGSYIIIGKTYLKNGAAGQQNVTCELVAAPSFDRNLTTVAGFNDVPVTFTVVHTYTTDGGAAQLKCNDFGNPNVTANWIKITAIEVNNLVNVSG